MKQDIFSVNDLCVLISGSSRGIGLSVARGFLERGAKVTISSEDASELKQALELLKSQFPNRVFGAVCDVRSFSACQNAVKQAVSEMGTLTTTICNAGVDRIKPVESYNESDWKFILEVNLQGAFSLAQAAIQYYLENTITGSITFTSSICSSIGINGLVPYSASKGGINQLTKTMAAELAQHNIRVNAVAPGYVDNLMAGVALHSKSEEVHHIKTFTPLGRKCQLHELIGPYIFLASYASSYVTGHVLYVDGGYTAI